ncbi:MAG: Gfo/Idh/MocA family oxidoreductase [Planctomycetaceae bacterium]|nr:Gfo/Idh/MocA family oxidoreductase [Planctomycetaceae bacterium]
MSDPISRRDFVKSGTAATAAFMSTVPLVHARGQETTIKIGLVGCGGRGSGAAENCLASAGNVQLTALGDMFPDRIKGAQRTLSKLQGYKVSDEMVFTGWDAYKKVVDSSVDLVLFATPPGFRPIHLAYAVEKGKHAFIEKPCAVDPVGVKKVLELGKKAAEKKLAIVAGTQYRHQTSFMETIKRIHDGQIGDVVGGRAYYNAGALWKRDRKPEMSEMEYQLRMWIYYDWLSGDQPVEQHIHTIDVTDWAMNARPVKAVATGGRQVRVEPEFGNVYDHFTIDYEYPGGKHVMSMCRQMANVANHVGAYFVGTKGEADVYKAEIKGEKPWKFEGEISIAKAYIQEHTDLINSIRNGKPLNEAEHVAHSTLTAILGREAAYTGKVVTWDEMMASDLDLSPEKYEFGPNVARPVPKPGTER